MSVSLIDLLNQDPEDIADVLVPAAKETGRDDWLDDLCRALDRRRARDDFARILEVWGLNQTEAGRLFGVSRQAVSKSLARGVPTARVQAVADLAAATDLLVRYLKRDRIPAVVRRPAARLGGLSLVEVASTGRTGDVLAACRAMFGFGEVHA